MHIRGFNKTNEIVPPSPLRETRRRKNLGLFLTLILLILGGCIFDPVSVVKDKKFEEQKEQMNKVEKGMTILQVIDILGEPDSRDTIDLSKNIYYYYFENNTLLSSGTPAVGFDSNGVVILTTMGD